MNLQAIAEIPTSIRRWKSYPAYKDSGVEWLGKVPAHWETKKIKRLCLVKRGASPRPIEDPIYFDDDGEYSWVRISDVTASTKYLERTEQRLSELGKSKSVALEPGELFLSIAATVGKPIITKIKCCIHDGFVYFVGLRENREYLFYLLSSGELYKGIGKTGTQLNLNTDTIGDIRIPLPSLAEQEGIVTFLDRETAKIDALVAKKEQLIELLQEKRAALITRAVTKGLDLNVPMKNSGVEWLGKIPAHWRAVRVKHTLQDRISGPFGSSLTKDLYSGNTYRVYGQEQVIPADFSVGDYYIPESKFHAMMRYAVRAGDVLLSCVGTFGRAVVVPEGIEPGIINPRLILLRPDQNTILPPYLELFLKSKLSFAQMEEISRGGTMDIINLSTISALVMPLPPRMEQTQILHTVRTESFRIDRLIAKVHEGIERLKEFRTALISAAVTGKIDVRQDVVA